MIIKRYWLYFWFRNCLQWQIQDFLEGASTAKLGVKSFWSNFCWKLHKNEINFFLKFLEDMNPFCCTTDTPILDFWWRLLWVSKPEWVLPYSSLAEAYVLHYTFPEIHLWCDTCQPLGGQHGSRAVSSTYLQGIGGTPMNEINWTFTLFIFTQIDLGFICLWLTI